MNRSIMGRELRYAEGGEVAAGIGTPLVTFTEDQSYFPIPTQNRTPEFMNQFALSNYTTDVLEPGQIVVPTDTPPARGNEGITREKLNALYDKATKEYLGWQELFKYNLPRVQSGRDTIHTMFGSDTALHQQAGLNWGEYSQAQQELDELTKKYLAANPGTALDYNINRDTFGETLWNQIRGTWGNSGDPWEDTWYQNKILGYAVNPLNIPGNEDFTAQQISDYWNDFKGTKDWKYTADGTVTYRPPPPRDNSYASGGPVGTMDPMNASIGFKKGNLSLSNDEMKEITNITIAAIAGEIPNSEEIIKQFISIFGQEEFERLKAMVVGDQGGGGPVVGPGGPKDDMVPAIIDGHTPAKLSNGEYVIPADAVVGIGNGDTSVGFERLDNLVQNYKAGIAA